MADFTPTPVPTPYYSQNSSQNYSPAVYGPANPNTSPSYSPAVYGPSSYYANSYSPTSQQGVLSSSVGPSSSGVGQQSSSFSGPVVSEESAKAAGYPNYAAYLQANPQQPSINFDALIQPALDALNQYIPVAQGQYDTNVQDINNQAQQQSAQANLAQNQELGTLDNSATQQQTSAQQADLQNRQQSSEIQQGLQARYGGTTGTGAFASELAGRQALQNTNKIQQGLQGVMADIGLRKQHVQEVTQQALQTINQQTGTLLNQARDRLDGALADIRNQAGTLQSRKAQLAFQAMQHYQDTVNAVNAQNAAFRQNLVLQAQQAQSQLAIAQQYAHNYSSGFNPTNFGDMSAQTTPVNNGGEGGLNVNQAFSSGGLSLSGAPISMGGQIDPRQLAQANQGGQLDLNRLKGLGLA